MVYIVRLFLFLGVFVQIAVSPWVNACAQQPNQRSINVRQNSDSLVNQDRAVGIINRAEQAVGGWDALSTLDAIRYEGIGFSYMNSIAGRPEGPQPTQFEEVKELLSLKLPASQRTSQIRFSFRPNTIAAKFVWWAGSGANVADGKVTPAGAAQVYRAQDELALNPLAALVNAAKATDLIAEPPAQIRGRRYLPVSFSQNGVKTRIFVNSETWLPDVIEITRAYRADIFSAMWGEITTRNTYGSWSLEPGSLRYPREWTTEVNGQPEGQFSITDLELNAKIDRQTFAIPAEVAAATEKNLALSDHDLSAQNFTGNSLSLGEGMVMLPGIERKYNSIVIRQPDGLIVIDAPYTSGNSALVLAEAEKQFPGQRVKALISTSQLWAHVGGIREYVARGIPIYALDRNVDLVSRLARAPHMSAPDELQLHPRTLIVRPVSRALTIGDGPTRLVIYPFRRGGGERMMAVYFPQEQLLYASDMYLPKPFAGAMWAANVAEVEGLVQREGLAVQNVFGIHMPPALWKNVTTELQKLRATDAISPPTN